MGETGQSFGQRLFNLFKGGSDNVTVQNPGQPQAQQQKLPVQTVPQAVPIQQPPADEPTKHRNIFEKMLGVGKPKPTPTPQPQPQDQPPQ